jgi:hypothetical protein
VLGLSAQPTGYVPCATYRQSCTSTRKDSDSAKRITAHPKVTHTLGVFSATQRHLLEAPYASTGALVRCLSWHSCCDVSFFSVAAKQGIRTVCRGAIPAMKTTELFVAASMLMAVSATATPIHFQTNDPDGKMAVASRPPSTGAIEIEAGDDFLLATGTRLTHATFTGLIPAAASTYSVEQVVVEIYRVFPFDSVNPPSGNVPARANSPSDNAFDTRDSAGNDELHYSASVVSANFTAANSVLNGIHPKPNQNTLGEGPVTGQEVLFDVSFDAPIFLPPGHYFFVPQVKLTTGDFLWLSAPKPIIAPGTPFTGDLQAWIRNEDLAPDWLRVGTDIVGGVTPPTFNATFSLDGDTEDVVQFATNAPDGLMAMASRPETNTQVEIEAADDFLLPTQSQITHATFTGLLPAAAALTDIDDVDVEIYRTFPFDSVNPPSGHVPTRNNSPSDNAFDTREDNGIRYTATVVNATFNAANSVLNGIHPSPNQNTLGEGPVSGQEVTFDVVFSPPFTLPAGHYFFVPQVSLHGVGDFYWLSAPKPIVAPGTPFIGDLQAWIRNDGLAPDWLRVGTDIVGGATPPTFNGAFTLDGKDIETVFHSSFE